MHQNSTESALGISWLVGRSWSNWCAWGRIFMQACCTNTHTHTARCWGNTHETVWPYDVYDFFCFLSWITWCDLERRFPIGIPGDMGDQVAKRSQIGSLCTIFAKTNSAIVSEILSLLPHVLEFQPFSSLYLVGWWQSRKSHIHWNGNHPSTWEVCKMQKGEEILVQHEEPHQKIMLFVNLCAFWKFPCSKRRLSMRVKGLKQRWVHIAQFQSSMKQMQWKLQNSLLRLHCSGGRAGSFELSDPPLDLCRILMPGILPTPHMLENLCTAQFFEPSVHDVILPASGFSNSQSRA